MSTFLFQVLLEMRMKFGNFMNSLLTNLIPPKQFAKISSLKFNHVYTPQDKKKEQKKEHYLVYPPYNKNVKMNIGKIFLKLVDRHCPKSNKRHKIFNRNTLKVSYSCTENMSQIIKKHNKRITNTTDKSTNPACNCRIKTKCPLNRNCLQPSVIYQATNKSKDNPGFLQEKNLRGVKDNRPLFFKTIGYCFYCSFYGFCKNFRGQKSFWGAPPCTPVAESQNLEKIYIRLTERPWNQRSYSHKLSFTNRK